MITLHGNEGLQGEQAVGFSLSPNTSKSIAAAGTELINQHYTDIVELQYLDDFSCICNLPRW